MKALLPPWRERANSRVSQVERTPDKRSNMGLMFHHNINYGSISVPHLDDLLQRSADWPSAVTQVARSVGGFNKLIEAAMTPLCMIFR